MTELDITPLVGRKLYPWMLWLLTDTVNEMVEFRTCHLPEGTGFFDTMNPSYTVFNVERKQFCTIWTEFSPDCATFVTDCQSDIERFRRAEGMFPKPGMPENVFCVSMIPWVNFRAFQLNLYKGADYLLPIFTLGKFRDENHRRLIPLAIQVHHAVCDGYHIGVFAEKLQRKIFSIDHV